MAGDKQYSVTALLKATDAGFSKTFKAASNVISGMTSQGAKSSSMFKSMFGANVVSSAFIGGINMAKNSVSSMVSELTGSNVAWKSFEGNMRTIGASASEIDKAKKSMQDYATKTIYSASDMAQTYAVLAAVGVKNTDKLVTGFGGLAAAAENPQQAMKTLSQQATQMAAKPQVAWADFKLMMEQSPAGIAAVAKEMGMSTAEMVKAVQDGKVSTEDFFDAISKVGNNTSFTKMATTFKSVGQAIDGLKEGLSNKLQPAFEVATQFGIEMASKIAESLDKVNFDKLASNLNVAIENIKKFFGILGGTGAFSAIQSALGAIGKAIGHVFGSFAGKGDQVTSSAVKIGDAIVVVAGKIEDFANWISKIDPSTIKATAKAIVGVVIGFKAIKTALGIGTAVKGFFGMFKKEAPAAGSATSKLGKIIESIGKSIGSASKGIGEGFGKILEGLGKGASKINPAQWFGISIAILAVGTAVLIASYGFERMASASVMLSNAGAGAMAMFTAMLAGLIGLVAVVGMFGAGLSAGAVGMIAFGAMAVLVGVAIAIIASQADGLSKIISAIGTAFSQVVIAIGTAVAMILPMLPPIILAIASLVTTVTTGISQIVFSIASGVAMIINSFTGLLFGISVVINSISGVIQAFSGLLRTIFDGISQVITATAEGIKTVLTGLGDAFKSLGESIKLVLDGAKGVIEGFGNTVRNILDGIAKIFDSMGNAALNAGKGMQKVADGISTLVGLPTGDLIATLGSVGKNLGTIASHGPGMVTAGNGAIMLSNGLARIASSGASATASIRTIPASASQMQVAFTAASASVQSSMRAIVNSIISGGNQMKSASKAAGIESGRNFATGIQSAAGSVKSAVSALTSAASSTANNARGILRSAGYYLGAGLAAGMRQSLPEVRAAADALVAQANRAAIAKGEIRSPSRLMKRTVGVFLGMGIAKGIEESQPYVDAAMNDMYNSMNSFDFIGDSTLSSDFAFAVSDANANITTDTSSQNKLMRALIDKLDDLNKREIALYIDKEKFARTTGDAINDYTIQKQSSLKRLGGEV